MPEGRAAFAGAYLLVEGFGSIAHQGIACAAVKELLDVAARKEVELRFEAGVVEGQVFLVAEEIDAVGAEFTMQHQSAAVAETAQVGQESCRLKNVG